MSPDELDKLLVCETERVEWKESAHDTDNVLQPTCALANDLGASNRDGFLLFGVRKDGSIKGIGSSGADLDNTQKLIANRLTSTAIVPSPSFSVELVEREGRHLIVVKVAPYRVPPVVCVKGVAWVRKGTTTQRATDADLVRLRERRPISTLSFDSRPLEEASLDALEMSEHRRLYRDEEETSDHVDTFPTFEQWLSLRHGLGMSINGVWRPTAAAVLVHGRSPQEWLPCAIVEFTRYAGTDIDAAVVSRKTITGSLPSQLTTLWEQLVANVDDAALPADGIRQAFAPRYPLEALKELARNMIQHRLYEGTNAPARVEWYNDRVEFSNPGGPFGRASEGEFGDHSDYRNPAVTKLLVDLGYVQRLGRGIRIVRKLLAELGSSPLRVETDGFTRVIVGARP